MPPQVQPQPQVLPTGPGAYDALNSMAQSNQPKGNWFERLLPTIGGIGGGILGSIASPILGSAAGAGAGSSLGQELENKLTGSKTGVASTGIENALGGLVGGVAGQGIGAVLGKAGSMADNAAVSAMMKQAEGNIDRPTAEYLLKNGVTNFNEATKIVPQITGSTGGEGAALSNRLVNALSNSESKIPVNEVTKNWASYLDNFPGISDTTTKNISNTITKSFGQMAKDSGYDVTGMVKRGGTGMLEAIEPGALSNMQPGAVYQQIKNLEKLAYSIQPRTLDQQAAKSVYQNVARDLEEATYGGGNGVALSTADKAGIIQDISGLQKTNPSLFNALKTQISQAGTWKDIRSIQQPFVQVGKAADTVATQAAKTIGTTPSDIMKGTLGMTQGKTGLAKAGVGGFLGSPTASQGETSILSKIGAGSQGKIASKILPRAVLASAIAGANLPNMAQSSQSGMTQPPTSTNMGTGAAMQPTATGITPYNSLLNAMISQAILEPNVGGGASSFLSSVAPSLQKATAASAAIPGFESQFGAAGGAAGIGGGGILDTILAQIPGTPQNAAKQQAGLLTGALGVSPTMAPSFLQAPGTASTQLSTLQGIAQALGGAPVQ